MTINCKGTLVDLSSPKVMGILNITPDSFYDGGKYKDEIAILKQVEKMLLDGATFIDVGAYSSRPGAKHISEEEELQRIIPVIDLLMKNFPEIIISVDTFRSKVALETINSGAAIINDISGGTMDAKMFETVANLQVPYILMHMLGTPQNMQKNPVYKDVVEDIISFFAEQIFKLHQLKLNDIIIDVGFGFGKTLDDNFELLKNMQKFQVLGCPLLAGLSRKSMINKVLGTKAKEALNGTTALNMLALQNGANLLRVHDVKEAMECIQIASKI